MQDFYAEVPCGIAENLQYRRKILRAAARDEGLRRALTAACKHDVLFFFSAFCWLHEPRPALDAHGNRLPSVIPFVPWPHQVREIRRIKLSLGLEDIGVEKSRGEGASWIGVLLALHDWLFDRDCTVGMCSSNEEKADKPGDRGSLMGKLDWELTMLPKWMVGVKDRDWSRNMASHSLRRISSENLIVAHAATAGTGRGHRYKWFFLDELGEWRRGDDEAVLASLQHATNSRLIVSTPAGSSGAYYELMHEPSSMVKVVLDWKDNLTRNRGLYRFQDGKAVALDPVGNPLPDEYVVQSPEVLSLWSRLRRKGFKIEGTDRSPWYDNQCDRPRATPQSIAQELDRDYGGSMYRVFGHDFFEKAEEGVRNPFRQGNLSYHPETLAPEFDATDDGQLLLWTPLDAMGRPPPHAYAAGVDIASGLGGSYTSNSAIEIIDVNTMEQVCEFAGNTIQPADFADFCIALCKMFNNAYLAWEHSGPGAAFTKRVIDRKYQNVYYRKVHFKRSSKQTKELGWWTTDNTKEVMFMEFMRTVRHGELKLRSDLLVKECGQYVRTADGKIDHVLRAKTQDSSSRGKSHGDRVIAACVALQAVRDRPLLIKREYRPEAPPGSFAARDAEHEAATREADSWDGRTNWDLGR